MARRKGFLHPLFHFGEKEEIHLIFLSNLFALESLCGYIDMAEREKAAQPYNRIVIKVRWIVCRIVSIVFRGVNNGNCCLPETLLKGMSGEVPCLAEE